MPPKKDAAKKGEGPEPDVDVSAAMKDLKARWERIGTKFGNLIEPATIQRVEKCLSECKKCLTFQEDAPVPATARVLFLGLLDAFTCQSVDKLSQQIRKLCMWRTHLGDDGFPALVQMLRFGSVKYLELMDNQVTGKSMHHLADAMSSPGCSLVTLSLDFNPLGSEGAVALSRAIGQSVKLTNLSLQYCSIGAEGGAAIGANVVGSSACTALTEINLQGNQVGSPSLPNIGKALGSNTTLKQLILSDNCISEDVESLKSLRDGLAHNDCLEVLSLESNLIGEEGAKLFTSVLEMKPNLRSFRVTTHLHSDTFNTVFRNDAGKKKKGKGKKGKK